MWRRFFADSIAAITFSTAVAMVIEVLISGMSVEQSLVARLIAAPITVAAGGPYGMFRDWIFRKTRTTYEAHFLRKGLSDITAFVIFQVPLYATTLAASGAQFSQIITACATMSIAAAVMGRPFGLFMEFVRRLFGVATTSTQSAAR